MEDSVKQLKYFTQNLCGRYSHRIFLHFAVEGVLLETPKSPRSMPFHDLF